jgi:type I restriction enzyme S subunit
MYWNTAKLTEVVRINPRNVDFALDDSDEVTFLPMAGVEAETGRINITERRTWKTVKKGYTKFQENDVLVAKITPCMENGKACIARHLHGAAGAGSTEFHVFRPDTKIIEPEWLYLFLNQKRIRSAAKRQMGGAVGQQRVPASFYESLVLPLPDIEKQRELLESLIGQGVRITQIEEELRSVLKKLKRARASILKAAVEGRLVETEAEIASRENTDYESGGLLLERILYLRENNFRIARQHLNKKIKYPRPFTPSQVKTNILPEGWAIATIDQLTNYSNGSFIGQGWSPKCLSREAHSSEWCVMKTTAIQPLRFDSGSNKALPQGLDPRPDLELTSGDLLITRAGPRTRVGVCCLIEKTRSKVMLCDKAYRIRPSRLCLGKYLEIALNSQSASHSIEQIKTGINDSGVNITQSGYLNLLIPLPPLSEQNRIVDEVDRRFSVLDQVEATVTASLARCGKLRQAILKQAFEGRLVQTA